MARTPLADTKVGDAPRLGQARRQRLLDEQGLAGPACRLHDGGVERWRNRHDHGVHARVGHEIVVVIVESAARSRGELLPFRTIPTADGDEGGVRQVLYDVAGVARPVLAKADQPDAEHWARSVSSRLHDVGDRDPVDAARVHDERGVLQDEIVVDDAVVRDEQSDVSRPRAPRA